MAFDAADSYTRFMGRWAEPLAPLFADAAGVGPGRRALDVGCGPGALTAVLVERLGAERVVAVDPSPPFVAALGRRLPGVETHRASAEDLPFADGAFDLALCQLVVHFMTDPVAGLREMARVTALGGTVAACVWDLSGGTGPLAAYERAVRELDPTAPDEADLPGAREGLLHQLCERAGLVGLADSELTLTLDFASFEEWWDPFTLGVGPAGDYVRGLDRDGREALARRCAELLPSAPFTLSATAWCTTGRPGPS